MPTDLFALLWMLPFALMAFLVLRHHYRRFKRRQATAFNERLMRYHDGLNTQRHLYTRREATAEMLAALAFCAVISAILLACLACNDAADLATLIKP